MQAHLLEELLHNFGSVVDSKDDVSDASGNQSLDLVHNHGLVSKLDKGLGESQGLQSRSLC